MITHMCLEFSIHDMYSIYFALKNPLLSAKKWLLFRTVYLYILWKFVIILRKYVTISVKKITQL